MRPWLTILAILILAPSWAQIQQTDSLAAIAQSKTSVIQKPEQKVDSIESAFYVESDSLKQKYKTKLSGLDSVKASFQQKKDSLDALHLPTDKYTHKLDSIRQRRMQAVSELSQKVDSLKAKTSDKLKKLNLPPELNDKVSAATKNVGDFKLPSKDLNIPSLDLPDNQLKNLDGLNTDIKSPLAQTGKIDGLPKMPGELNEVSNITKQAGGYTEDVKNVTQGNLGEVKQLPETAETKAAELSGLDQVKDQTKGMDQFKDQAGEYKDQMGKLQDQDALKEQMKQQATEKAVDHFAGKEQALQQAMQKVSKYKMKYSSLNSLSDTLKKRPNEMHDKPLIERLVPGVAIQIQKRENDLLVDFNAYVGYRFTGRFTAGLGWNQRVPYNTNRNEFNARVRVYGPRMYAEYKVFKGISPRLEVEVMNTIVPPWVSNLLLDLRRREWVWSYFAGLKKDYQFVKTVKGTAMIMFNLYNPEHRSPYADVLNVRFGFEFPMKKKKRSEKPEEK